MPSDTQTNNPSLVKQQDWFAGGRRVGYDPTQKRIIDNAKPDGTVLSVFERVRLPNTKNNHHPWLTMLPGFPDGSYGYAKMNGLMEQKATFHTWPMLYVEYVGQGDSDKPADYPYSTMERADLVQAQWQAHGVLSTVVVTFDYSSLVLLELLRRQQEQSLHTKITAVLVVNGGLFADGHSHPWTTTPLLQTTVGRMGARLAQTADWMFHIMMAPLWSWSYRRQQRVMWRPEMIQSEAAIRRHNGTAFLSNAAGFVKEHQQKDKAVRWDLYHVCNMLAKASDDDSSLPTMHIVGSTQDPFEYGQIDLAKQRLHEFYPTVQVLPRIPGGHMSTSEQAAVMVQLMEDLMLASSRGGMDATHTASSRGGTQKVGKDGPSFNR